MFAAVMSLIWGTGFVLYLWGMSRWFKPPLSRFIESDGWISYVAILLTVATAIGLLIAPIILLLVLFPGSYYKRRRTARGSAPLPNSELSEPSKGPALEREEWDEVSATSRRPLAVALVLLTLVAVVTRLGLLWVAVVPEWVSASLDTLVGFGIMASMVGLSSTTP